MPVLKTVRDVVDVARDRDVPFLAAALAHYTLASLVPLLLLAVALAALFGSGDALESFLENQLGTVLTDEGQAIVSQALSSTEGAVGAGLLSIVLAFWSGSKIFRGLDVAFHRIYGIDETPSLPTQLKNAAIVIVLLAVTIAAMVLVGIAVAAFEWPIPYPTAIGTVVLLLALFVGLLPIYYVLTPGEVTIEDVLPGSILAAFGLVALQVVFVIYTQFASSYATLGVLGALLLFVIWLYFGGIIVLLGGALNYVLRRPLDQGHL